MTDVDKLARVLKQMQKPPTEIAAYMGWSIPTYYSRVNGESEWKATEIVNFTALARLSRPERDAIFLGD